MYIRMSIVFFLYAIQTRFAYTNLRYTPLVSKGGAKNLKVGDPCIGMWGVNAVKTLTFEKGGGA